MAIASVNPATGAVLREFEALTGEQVDAALRRAVEAFAGYRHTTFAQRTGWLAQAARILESEADELARLATLEMGKTLAAARAEVLKCARGCRYYAEHGPPMLADRPLPAQGEGVRAFLRYRPLGPVLAVMPWNFPYWQVFRFAAPALLAGNVGLLKHASNVPQCALAIEDVLHRAGLPDGAFQTLLVGSDRVRSIIEDPRVRAVTLTGSEPAGREVGAAAGAMIKPSVLELGGSDPFIVLPSADLPEAVRAAVGSRILNNGQSCINAKRFIVHEQVADEFERRLIAAFENLTVGDPLDETTDVGPMSTPAGVDELTAQVDATVAAGGRLLTGGKALDGPGNFYPPTILTDIPPGSPGHREEFFGPVALLFRARDLTDAVRIANDSDFALGASVWTTDPAEQDLVSDELDAGMLFVNHLTESSPELPFGGTKNSGYGRELSTFGPHSFTNPTTIHITTPTSS